MTNFANRISVAICETQPIVVEGLRATLNGTDAFALIQSAGSLDEAFRIAIGLAPKIMIVDKGVGSSSVLDWIGRVHDRTATAIIVWSAVMTEPEALRFLKAGARGVVSKTAQIGTLLACLDSVAEGKTWMEDTLFRDHSSSDRRSRSELTLREQQVLELVEQGLRNKEIGHELGIRPGTVKIHLKHIFEKTGVHGRYGLALSGLKERSDLALSA
jgi:DNA-binding NarL/FixJ family response regulator